MQNTMDELQSVWLIANPIILIETVLSLSIMWLLVLGLDHPEARHSLNSVYMRKLMALYLMCRAYVILKPEFAFPLSYYLIPFTGVVGMIILVMVVIMVSSSMERVFYICPPEFLSREDGEARLPF